jgi:uncharacterized Fe-S center protein
MKLEKIIEQLNLRDRVRGETVAIKMHLGGNVGYSTVHPVFVCRLVQAVRDGGGKPFVCDIAHSVATAYSRGYTHETLGCPVYPVGGPDEKYFYTFTREYKNIKEWRIGGLIHDASFLIDLAHVKGHPSCGFAAAFKNLAVGAVMGPTRAALHDTMHFDKYWFSDRCPTPEGRKAIVESCPFGGLVVDKANPTEIHIHFDNCNQCRRCLEVAPEGSLRIDPINFASFQEANAMSVALTLSTFKPGKAVFVNVAAFMTPVCDCYGFTGMPVLPDVGVLGSDDIVSIDQATLDLIAPLNLIGENLPGEMEMQSGAGHPFQILHGPYKDPYLVVKFGEKLGLGSRRYELVDIMPLEKIERSKPVRINASDV